MGYLQEADCVAIARALAEAVESQATHARQVRIFTDAMPRSSGWRTTNLVQAEPTPFRRGSRSRPCASRNPPSKLRSGGALHTKEFPVMRSQTGGPSAPASEPDDHGVEWLAQADKYGTDPSLLDASEAQALGEEVAGRDNSTKGICSGRRASRIRPGKAEKRTASRYYQLKSVCVLEADKEQTGRPLPMTGYPPDQGPFVQTL